MYSKNSLSEISIHPELPLAKYRKRTDTVQLQQRPSKSKM